MTHTRNAFTLIEVLICLAIIAVLLALAIPLGTKARQRMTETRCTIHMRSVGTILSAYTADHRGVLPFAGVESIRETGPDNGPEYVRGSVIGYEQSWATLFPDEWSGQYWNAALQCPKQPRYDPNASAGPGDRVADGALQMPVYFMSRTAWIDPETLRPDSIEPDWLIRPVRESEVLYPSAKAILHEWVPYCVPEARGAIRSIFQSLSFPISIATHDGAVIRAPRDSFDASGRFQLVYTPWGVRGRDLVPLN